MNISDIWIQINSLGPYNHGAYKYDKKIFSHEGPLTGRSDYLLNEAIEKADIICKNISKSRSNIRILEIGSYDGWLSSKLFAAGFKKITSIEPRAHNISRGYKLRKLLAIKDQVKHLNFDINKLSKKLFLLNFRKPKFDLIICFGVIHHLQDINFSLQKISKLLNVRGGGIIIECVTLNDEIFDKRLGNYLETKDVTYFNEPNIEYGFVGIKKESNYFPGSTFSDNFVMIPSTTALKIILENCNIEISEVRRGFEKDKNRTQLLNRKNIYTNLFFGVKKDTNRISEDKFYNYENLFINGLLNKNCLLKLQHAINQSKYLFMRELNKILSVSSAETYQLIQTLKYNPNEKLKFELIKHEIHGKNYEKAKAQLIELISSDFCNDWRVAYRSFFTLCYLDSDNSEYWLKLGLSCNPEFPIQVMQNKMFFTAGSPKGINL